MNIEIKIDSILERIIREYPSIESTRKENRNPRSRVPKIPTNDFELNTYILENTRKVRSARMDNKTWFVLNDILGIWPINNYPNWDFARDSLPEAETRIFEVLEDGQTRKYRFVTLAGALLVAPGAFAGWKTHENLIQILLKASTND